MWKRAHAPTVCASVPHYQRLSHGKQDKPFILAWAACQQPLPGEHNQDEKGFLLEEQKDFQPRLSVEAKQRDGAWILAAGSGLKLQ